MFRVAIVVLVVGVVCCQAATKLNNTLCNGSTTPDGFYGNLLVLSQKVNCTWLMTPPSDDVSQVLLVTVAMAASHNSPNCNLAFDFVVLPNGEKRCTKTQDLCRVYISPSVQHRHSELTANNFDDVRLQTCSIAWQPATSWPPSLGVQMAFGLINVNVTYEFIQVERLLQTTTSHNQGKRQSSTISSTVESATRDLSVTLLSRAISGHAAAAASTALPTHTTSYRTEMDDVTKAKSMTWALLLALAVTCLVVCTVLLWIYRHRRKSKSEAAPFDDINPYAVHVTASDRPLSPSGYSNVTLLERPYDVIDRDGVQQRRKPRTRANNYLEPIQAQQASPYCEITVESPNAAPNEEPPSFGRGNFFLYDVATDVTQQTNPPPKDYTLAKDPNGNLPKLGDFSAVDGSTDVVQYSEIIGQPEEDPYVLPNSPTFTLTNSTYNSNAEMVPGPSPYGEIIGTLESDGALRRFTESEDTYKSVRKKQSEQPEPKNGPENNVIPEPENGPEAEIGVQPQFELEP